jgi:hypothetical protein
VRIEIASDPPLRRPRVATNPCDLPESLPEARSDEPPVRNRRIRLDERNRPPPEDEHPGVDSRPGTERAARQPAREGRLPERAPDDAVHRAWPRESAPDRDVPLHDEVSAHERSRRVVEQHVHEVGRPVERKVRDDTKLVSGQLDSRCVTDDDVDVLPAPLQSTREHRIDLDGDDPACDPRQLLGDAAASGTDLENELTRPDLGIADELGSELCCSKEVLATRRSTPRAASASAGHGSGS